MPSATRLALGMLLSCLLGVLGCRAVARPDGGRGHLPAGAPAPPLRGETEAGRAAALSDARGHFAVVYFYPKDGTPGCTTEACAFRDAFARYQQRGIRIFGVSQDSPESHREFAREHALPFALVADESGQVAQAYGVSSTFGFSSRVTFLVGPDGNVAHVWPDVDPALHADAILAWLDQHAGAREPHPHPQPLPAPAAAPRADAAAPPGE